MIIQCGFQSNMVHMVIYTVGYHRGVNYNKPRYLSLFVGYKVRAQC